MEVLAHSFGITVRVPGQAPITTGAAQVLHLLLACSRFGARPYIQPRMPDPNP